MQVVKLSDTDRQLLEALKNALVSVGTDTLRVQSV